MIRRDRLALLVMILAAILNACSWFDTGWREATRKNTTAAYLDYLKGNRRGQYDAVLQRLRERLEHERRVTVAVHCSSPYEKTPAIRVAPPLLILAGWPGSKTSRFAWTSKFARSVKHIISR